MLEMLPRRVDMIGDERAARADLIRTWCQHEMIDGELALAAEQVAERAVALGSFKDIGLLDLGPWQLPALGAQFVERVCQGALLGQKRLGGGKPLFARNDWMVHDQSPLLCCWSGALSRAAGSELQPGRQVEKAHQQIYRGHAVDRQSA